MEPEQSTRWRVWAGFAVLALLIIGIGYAFYYGSSLTSLLQRPTQISNTLDGVPLKGTLYLTLEKPADAKSGGNTYLNTYTYDLKTQSLTPFFNNEKRNITVAFSPDGKHLAYATRLNSEPAFQIFTADANGQNSKQVTLDANRFKREPAWSSKGLIAYSVQSETSNANPLAPNTWSAFVVDPSKTLGDECLAGVGVDPFFSPDGNTLFTLQNDGIHATSVSQIVAACNKTGGVPLVSTIVAPTLTGSSTRSSQTMKISVSPDGTRLAWSAPMAGFVRIFQITSWSPLTLLVEKDLPIHAYYSAFSPDSQYLALEQVDLDSQKNPTNPHIVVYHLSTYDSTEVSDLSQYKTNRLWLSTWR